MGNVPGGEGLTPTPSAPGVGSGSGGWWSELTPLTTSLNITPIMKSPSYHEIAADWRLWQMYVDTIGVDSEEEFHAMTVPEKVAIIGECFGPEQREEA